MVTFGGFLKNLKFAVKQCFECDILSLNFLFLVMTHVPLGLKKSWSEAFDKYCLSGS